MKWSEMIRPVWVLGGGGGVGWAAGLGLGVKKVGYVS